MADNRPAFIEADIIDQVIEYLLDINGYPEYHNNMAGRVFQDLALNQIIHEEQTYPVIAVNETANPSRDTGLGQIGDGRAEYDFDITLQIVGVHLRDKARSLRADIVKAVPFRSFPNVRLVTLVDSSIAFQPANSDLLVVLVNYQFQYGCVIGHKVT